MTYFKEFEIAVWWLSHKDKGIWHTLSNTSTFNALPPKKVVNFDGHMTHIVSQSRIWDWA